VVEKVVGGLGRYTITTIGQEALVVENDSKNKLWNQRYGYLKYRIWIISINLIWFMLFLQFNTSYYEFHILD